LGPVFFLLIFIQRISITMLKHIFIIIIAGWLSCTVLMAQSDIEGKWKTIDDDTNEPKSIVDIFLKDGKYFGKVVKLFRKPTEDQDPVCSECDPDDSRYNKKVIGMEILRDVRKSGSEFVDGTILDPKNGKVYRCKIWMEDTTLKLRGYWGPFYRTQTWHRVQ
jgi:uncharacterized protein (DUF2147 family)